jgi:hypothetical protein
MFSPGIERSPRYHLTYRHSTCSTKGAAAVPAAHYCCDGHTRPGLVTRTARCLAASAFFRKLTGDSRVVASFESTIAGLSTAIPLSAPG